MPDQHLVEEPAHSITSHCLQWPAIFLFNAFFILSTLYFHGGFHHIDMSKRPVRSDFHEFVFRAVGIKSHHSRLNLSCWQNGVASGSPGATEGGGDSLLNPPSVASLLDISLPGPPEEAPGEAQTHISDSIIELAINSAQYGAYRHHWRWWWVWFSLCGYNEPV